MGKLELLVSQRKIIRTKVTNLHTGKQSLSSLDAHQKHANRSILANYKDQLKEFDCQIQELKFVGQDVIDEKALGDEMNACHNYLQKIEECLPFLASEPVRVTVIVRDLYFRLILGLQLLLYPNLRVGKGKTSLNF